jgi:hypothetical protein
MKSLLLSLCLMLPLAAGVEPGFEPIFNGTDLEGWTRVNGTGEFNVENGEIVGTGKNVRNNTFLRTDKTYRDFDFRFEMKFDDLSGNSGMMFRGLQKEGNDGRVYGYQCEHDNGKDRAWTAGLYDEARRGWLVPNREKEREARAFTRQGQKVMKWDDWNEIRIECKDRHIKIWLNGELRVDYKDEAEEFTPEGFFALQVHSGESCNVRWRNLRIKEL